MKRAVLPIVAAVAAILAMISVARTRPSGNRRFPPSTPPTSSFEQVVAGVGLVEANSENIDVSCAVSGMVTQLYVKAGDHVGQGQKLFSLDDRDLRADQQVKRSALEGAQARMASSNRSLAPKTFHRPKSACVRPRQIWRMLRCKCD